MSREELTVSCSLEELTACRTCRYAGRDDTMPWCGSLDPGDGAWHRWYRAGRRPMPLDPADGLPTEETLALRGPCPEWAGVEP